MAIIKIIWWLSNSSLNIRIYCMLLWCKIGIWYEIYACLHPGKSVIVFRGNFYCLRAALFHSSRDSMELSVVCHLNIRDVSQRVYCFQWLHLVWRAQLSCLFVWRELSVSDWFHYKDMQAHLLRSLTLCEVSHCLVIWIKTERE